MENTKFSLVKVITFSVIGLFALITLISSFYTIGAGERGVLTKFGAVVGEVKQGLHMKIPFAESVVVFDVQTQKEQTDANSASSDLQTVSTKVAVNYNVDPTKVSTIYTFIGEDYGAKIIDPAIQETVKAVTANYTAEQLITKRAEVTASIQEKLTEKLAVNNIIVTSVNIVNFDFSGQFNAAIEAKVTAEQNALAAKNKLDQITYEGQQTIVSAKAQAESIKIQTEAINSQGGASYVALQKIKAWDGHACTNYCGLDAMFINTK